MITYFTDGSCSPNPGMGGFSVIKNYIPTIVGYELNSTNIRMEGKALMAALVDANGEECQILSDSAFWINVITKWAKSWKEKGWIKKNGEIKNLDIVRELYGLYQASNAKLIWVRGHVGNVNNELADVWANKAREQRLTGYLKEGDL
jgi:ribonuclease HI